ncbi:MAG: hypothetical protein N3E49_08260 [Bacteroidia bacterium]|nr:hypothetical protein [Bacteroidia bacterium]
MKRGFLYKQPSNCILWEGLSGPGFYIWEIFWVRSLETRCTTRMMPPVGNEDTISSGGGKVKISLLPDPEAFTLHDYLNPADDKVAIEVPEDPLFPEESGLYILQGRKKGKAIKQLPILRRQGTRTLSPQI